MKIPLTFVFRMYRSTTAIEGSNFSTEVDFIVECRDARREAFTAGLPRALISGKAKIEGIHDDLNVLLRKQGWSTKGENDYELSFDLPMSSHDMLTHTEGPLNQYWSREELLRFFKWANGEALPE